MHHTHHNHTCIALTITTHASRLPIQDIAHVQKTVAQNMADKARGAEDPLCRLYARMSLAGLPRGGGNGDDIRMGILHIMRNNGIK